MLHNCLPHITLAGEFTVKPGTVLGPRKIQEYELVFFPSASGTRFNSHGINFGMDTPCFIVTRPDEEHTYIFDPAHPTKHLFVHFEFSSGVTHESTSILQENGPSYIAFVNSSLIPHFLKQIMHLANTKPLYWKDRCDRHLYAILGELEGLYAATTYSQSSPGLPPQIQQALTYIGKHLYRSIPVAEIAAHVGWTHEHFTRTFVQHIGQTPQQAVMQCRIESACQLLLQEPLRIKEIAYTVGFEDEHYFSRTFVKLKGMTASQFREKFADSRLHHLAPVIEHETPYPLNRYFVFSEIK